MFDRLILASNYNRITRRFNMASLPDAASYEPSFNIEAGDKTYVITNVQNRKIESFKFGLNVQSKGQSQCLPFVRSEGDRNKNDDPHYTGSKAIFLKPEFGNLIRNQRCLVIADAFVVGIDDKPYLVYLRNKQRPLAFAAIWNKHFDDELGEEVNSFAIITTTANKLIQHLGYKKMPVILKQQCDSRWLRPSSELFEILDMLTPYPTNLMNAYPISTKIINTDLNEKSLVMPVGKPVYLEQQSYKRVNSVRKRNTQFDNLTLADRMKFSK